MISKYKPDLILFFAILVVAACVGEWSIYSISNRLDGNRNIMKQHNNYKTKSDSLFKSLASISKDIILSAESSLTEDEMVSVVKEKTDYPFFLSVNDSLIRWSADFDDNILETVLTLKTNKDTTIFDQNGHYFIHSVTAKANAKKIHLSIVKHHKINDWLSTYSAASNKKNASFVEDPSNLIPFIRMVYIFFAYFLAYLIVLFRNHKKRKYSGFTISLLSIVCILLLKASYQYLLGSSIPKITDYQNSFYFVALVYHFIRVILWCIASLYFIRYFSQNDRLYNISWYPRVIGVSIFLGVNFALSNILMIDTFYVNANFLNINLFSNTIAVNGFDLSITLMMVVSYTAYGLLISAILTFIFNTEVEHLKLVMSIIAGSYLATLLFYILMNDFSYLDGMTYLAYAVSFIVIIGSAFAWHKYPDIVENIPTIRVLMLISLSATISIYPVLIGAYEFNVNKKLHQAVYDFDNWFHSKEVQNREEKMPSPLVHLDIPVHIDVIKKDSLIFSKSTRGNSIFKTMLPLHTKKYSLKENTLLKSKEIESGIAMRFYHQFIPKNGYLIRTSTPFPTLRALGFGFFGTLFYLFVLFIAISILLNFVGLERTKINFEGERLQLKASNYLLLGFALFIVLASLIGSIIVRSQLRSVNSVTMSEVKSELLSILKANPNDIEQFKTDLNEVSELIGEPIGFYPNEAEPRLISNSLFSRTMFPEMLSYEAHSSLLQSDKDINYYKSPLPTFESIALSPLTTLDGKCLGIVAIPYHTFFLNNYIAVELALSQLLIFLLLFAIFLVVTQFIIKNITAPLNKIAKALQAISDGDLNTTIDISSKDEFGEMANTFNMMLFKIKELQTEMKEKERNAAWSEMARQIAHEIKNPLTPMKLTIQHLERKLQMEKDINTLIPTVQKVTKTLSENIESLNQIAGAFSSYAKPITEKFVEFDLNETLLSLLNLYKHDEKLDLSADLTQEQLVVYGAKEELRRVFINLLKNAIEALKQDGTVIIRSYAFKNEAVIEVIDNGTGIEEEMYKKVFVPNFSSKTSGTGLGLAISKRIINQHSGQISFASVVGIGTTFTIKIPLISSKDKLN